MEEEEAFIYYLGLIPRGKKDATDLTLLTIAIILIH